MNIIVGFPPNYREIRKAFPAVAGTATIFSYGDRIYNPYRSIITRPLRVHEETHGARQPDPAAWWDRYLTDRLFRLNEEILAHKAEYAELLAMSTPARAEAHLETVARKIAHKIYGPMIDYETARKEIAA